MSKYIPVLLIVSGVLVLLLSLWAINGSSKPETVTEYEAACMAIGGTPDTLVGESKWYSTRYFTGCFDQDGYFIDVPGYPLLTDEHLAKYGIQR